MRQLLPRTIVSLLTLRPSSRHGYVTQRRRDRLRGGAAMVLLVIAAAASGAPRQAWQPIDDIASAAERYLQAKIGTSAARNTNSTSNRTTVRAGTLDPRHHLPLCDGPLQAFMRRGARIDARTIVGVRCTGNKPWKVYVPVDVVVTAPVYVAGRTLPRGHLLSAADLAMDERDVSRLVSGYIRNPAELIGQRLKHSLIAGRMFAPAMLQADRIVRRGQTVTLTAAGGHINISMTGKALMDGARHQRIKVKNVNSGRIIEGIVRSSEQVEVLAPTANHFYHAKPKVSP